jgi:hypothetical protein
VLIRIRHRGRETKQKNIIYRFLVDARSYCSYRRKKHKTTKHLEVEQQQQQQQHDNTQTAAAEEK